MFELGVGQCRKSGLRAGDQDRRRAERLGEVLHPRSGRQSGHAHRQRAGVRHGRQVRQRVRRRAAAARAAQVRQGAVGRAQRTRASPRWSARCAEVTHVHSIEACQCCHRIVTERPSLIAKPSRSTTDETQGSTKGRLDETESVCRRSACNVRGAGGRAGARSSRRSHAWVPRRCADRGSGRCRRRHGRRRRGRRKSRAFSASLLGTSRTRTMKPCGRGTIVIARRGAASENTPGAPDMSPGRAFSGKVGTGFPKENATKHEPLDRLPVQSNRKAVQSLTKHVTAQAADRGPPPLRMCDIRPSRESGMVASAWRAVTPRQGSRGWSALVLGSTWRTGWLHFRRRRHCHRTTRHWYCRR